MTKPLNTLKISTIVTAGGTSNRFGSNKLLEILQETGKSVIQSTVEKFLEFSDEIVIPCHDDVKEHLEQEGFTNIKFAPFGVTRQESVFNALKTCDNPDFVLIHDGARPFITKETIQKTIEEVKVKNAVLVGIWAIDTIKTTDETGKILKTLDRKTIFQAQTPQAFKFDLILNAHKKLEGESFTDDSGMIESLNIPVYAVEGNISNKKITFKEDL